MALAQHGSAVLAVRSDCTQPTGWWYDGGGLYRHVSLYLVPSAASVDIWGGLTCLVPLMELLEAEAFADALISPIISVVSFAQPSLGDISCEVDVQVTGHGIKLRSKVENQTFAAGSSFVVNVPLISIKDAHLWSPDSPSLYQVVVTITSSTGSIDRVTEFIGIRKTEWSRDKGFILNGIPTKIKGAANHQDFAGIGVAVPDVLQLHRISKLKDMGANGWRTAHNCPTKALLDAADRLGFLVWDENHINGQDDELMRLVKRDRNHPSVIIWSICNEKLCNTNDTNGDGKRMHDLFHSLDPLTTGSFPQTSIHGLAKSKVHHWTFRVLTTQRRRTMPFMQQITLPLISSETSSAVSDRAVFANNATAGHVTAYDTQFPSWGESAEGAWGGQGQENGQGDFNSGISCLEDGRGLGGTIEVNRPRTLGLT